MKNLLLIASTLLLGLLALSAQAAPTQSQKDAAAEARVVATQKPSYPLDVCAVSGEKLGDKTVDLVVDGRLIRVCCAGCKKPATKDAAAIAKKIEAAVVKAQTPIYPMDTCVVSGEKLGSMGDVIEHVEGTRLVRFCCQGCAGAYKADPVGYMADVDKALVAKLKKSYALQTCPISDKPLGKNAIDKLYGVELVRVCCSGCIKPFEKDPAASLAKVRAAAKKAGGAKPAQKGAKGKGVEKNG